MANVFTRYGVGVDMSKDTFHACIGGMNEQQFFKVIAQRKFKNGPSGFKDFINWITKHRKDQAIRWQIFMEVTGVYHEGLLYMLHKLEYPACLLLGKRVKQYLQVIGFKSKNDKLDGRGMAQMACERKGILWKPVSEEILKIRAVLRHRKALINSKNQFENQLHAIQFSALKHSDVIRSLKRMIKSLSNQILKAESKAMELAEKDEAFFDQVKQIVDSVKGLGMISVLTVLAETNGFKTFTSSKQLVSYAGYDIVENSSGKHIGKTRISKKGNTHIRANMYMPALAVIRSQTSPFYQLYLRLLKRNGGIKKKALVAVQRKLLVLIYTLWKKNEPFDLKYYQAA
jgi:transposase